jgi:hypothetical protein
MLNIPPHVIVVHNRLYETPDLSPCPAWIAAFSIGHSQTINFDWAAPISGPDDLSSLIRQCGPTKREVLKTTWHAVSQT